MPQLFDQLKAALADRYAIEHELGQGGMAVVFLAEDLKHHRRVAVKVLKPELSVSLGADRFLREIEIAARLQHAHILPLFESGESAGLFYYVMPFVEGESLRQRLDRESPLPLAEAFQITREVGSALQYAHQHGVVHRDIKPENIMLSGGHAIVTDFGIARALHASGAEKLTQSGMLIGTPQYMSPEQASGLAVDGRTDQYSLACTLYEMLIGQPPFSGPSAVAILARQSVDPVPSLRVVRDTVSDGVEAAIKQAMAKMPADRFGTIEKFLNALASPEAPVRRVAHPHSRAGWWSGKRLAIAVGATVLIAAAVVLGVHPPWRSAGPVVRAVAVLPFQDADSSGSYLRQGVTDGLIAELAQVASLKVIAGASGSAAQGTGKSLPVLARDLGVDAVVQGSIQRTGDTIGLHVMLLHGADSTVLFTRDYRAPLGELPDLQREITVALAGSIQADLKGTERSRLGARHAVDQRAYEAYLRGRFYLEQGELERARMMFEQAAHLAVDWAPPLVGLANYYASLPFSSDIPPADVLPKARAALTQALALDETLAEAHAANGYIRAYYEWDWRAAEQEFRRALELRPNYADAYFSYSRFLASRGRLDEAIAQLDRAVELDPLSPGLLANRALLDYFAGRYDLAERQLRELFRSDSSDGLVKWGLALVAEQQGRTDEAIRLLEPISTGGLNRKSSLGHLYGMAGKTAQARAVLVALRARARHEYVPSYFFALVHAGLGERDQALRYLERAYEERSTVLAYLRIDPRLAVLRDDPRFVALARRLGEQ